MSRRVRKTVATAEVRPQKAPQAAQESRPGGKVQILVDGVRVEVSPQLEAAVYRAYQGLNRTLPAEMTTSQAADFLDVSRPFIIKLINRRELPCRMVGKHRRISSAALVQYREKMFQRAKIATDEMAQLAQELGLYELEGPPPEAP